MSKTMFKTGEIVGGYEVIKFIAQGGMGEVYKVRNRANDRVRALKVTLPSLLTDKEMLERFKREIKTAARVRHTNLVEILEPGMHNGLLFLPMELLEGATLSNRIRREGVLSVDQALDVILPVCRAVRQLHTHGVIHRDLKPTNIFLALTNEGTIVPKVLDFGAARDVTLSESQTVTGQVIGTIPYMAPEQACGRRDIDARIDQYALGVILFECLTGRRPYEQDTNANILSKIIRGEARPSVRELAPAVSEALASVIEKTLSFHREQRFHSMDEFIVALASAAGRTLDPESMNIESTCTPISATDIEVLDSTVRHPLAPVSEETVDGERYTLPPDWYHQIFPKPSGIRRTWNVLLTAALLGCVGAGAVVVVTQSGFSAVSTSEATSLVSVPETMPTEARAPTHVQEQVVAEAVAVHCDPRRDASRCGGTLSTGVSSRETNRTSRSRRCGDHNCATNAGSPRRTSH